MNRLPAAPDSVCMFRVQEPLINLAMAKKCLIYAILDPYEREPISFLEPQSESEFDRICSHCLRLSLGIKAKIF